MQTLEIFGKEKTKAFFFFAAQLRTNRHLQHPFQMNTWLALMHVFVAPSQRKRTKAQFGWSDY